MSRPVTTREITDRYGRPALAYIDTQTDRLFVPGYAGRDIAGVRVKSGFDVYTQRGVFLFRARDKYEIGAAA